VNKRLIILSGLLAAQLLLVAAVNLTSEDYGLFQADEMLLSFETQGVDGLYIDDGTNSVQMKKLAGQWQLPMSGDFPANSGSVERLLNTLSMLKKGWPVAKTRSAARRFNVDEEHFERKLVLLSGDEAQATLYVGSSPGFRKVYVKTGLGNEVFAVEFNTWTAGAKADDWIDKEVLALDADDLERIEISGLTLQLQDGEWQVSDLAVEEQTNGDVSRSLVASLTGLRIQSLLGIDAKPEYRQDEPALELKVMRQSGDVLSYRFSKPEDASYYVLKRSDQEHYFQVAEYTVNPIKETTRETLVQARIQEALSDAVELHDETDEAGERPDEDRGSDVGRKPVEDVE